MSSPINPDSFGSVFAYTRPGFPSDIYEHSFRSSTDFKRSLAFERKRQQFFNFERENDPGDPEPVLPYGPWFDQISIESKFTYRKFDIFDATPNLWGTRAVILVDKRGPTTVVEPYATYGRRFVAWVAGGGGAIIETGVDDYLVDGVSVSNWQDWRNNFPGWPEIQPGGPGAAFDYEIMPGSGDLSSPIENGRYGRVIFTDPYRFVKGWYYPAPLFTGADGALRMRFASSSAPATSGLYRAFTHGLGRVVVTFFDGMPLSNSAGIKTPNTINSPLAILHRNAVAWVSKQFPA